VPVFLFGEGGDDTITVNTTASSGFIVSVDGGSGTNTLTVVDTTGGAAIQNFSNGGATGSVGVFYSSGVTDSLFYFDIDLVTNGGLALDNQPF
jgi:hypothetical protein